MPNRILRDGFVDSATVAALSDFSHRLYSNLLVKVDDAGRHDARVPYLRSQLFPVGTPHGDDDISAALEEITRGDALAIAYEVNGKPYVQLTNWRRCGKSERSRCPWTNGSFDIVYDVVETRDGPKEVVKTSLPDRSGMESLWGADGVRTGCVGGSYGVAMGSRPMTTDAEESNTDTDTDTDTDIARSARAVRRNKTPQADPPGFIAFWDAWPKHFRKSARARCLTRWRSGGLEAIAAQIMRGLNGWKRSRQWAKDGGEFIPGPLTWLNGERWNAENLPPAGNAGDDGTAPGFVRQYNPEIAAMVLGSTAPIPRAEPPA